MKRIILLGMLLVLGLSCTRKTQVLERKYVGDFWCVIENGIVHISGYSQHSSLGYAGYQVDEEDRGKHLQVELIKLEKPGDGNFDIYIMPSAKDRYISFGDARTIIWQNISK